MFQPGSNLRMGGGGAEGEGVRFVLGDWFPDSRTGAVLDYGASSCVGLGIADR